MHVLVRIISEFIIYILFPLYAVLNLNLLGKE
jgi:hypothetical protein